MFITAFNDYIIFIKTLCECTPNAIWRLVTFEVKEDLLDTSDVIGENFRFHDITDISLDVGRLPGMSVNTSLVT
jgi:hypothetical protein